MKRTKVILIISLILLLIMIAGVYPAGESTGGGSSNPPSSPPSNEGSSGSSGSSSSSSKSPKPPNCEFNSLAKDRIKCRLNYGDTRSVPEPCRGISKQVECINLYKKSRQCYEKEGVEKDICIKKVSGFKEKDSKFEKNPRAKRNYLLLLLYDLQEKVEDEFKEGKITDEQASDLINSIVDAKLTITKGRSKNEIKLAVDELKQKYEEVLS